MFYPCDITATGVRKTRPRLLKTRGNIIQYRPVTGCDDALCATTCPFEMTTTTTRTTTVKSNLTYYYARRPRSYDNGKRARRRPGEKRTWTVRTAFERQLTAGRISRPPRPPVVRDSATLFKSAPPLPPSRPRTARRPWLRVYWYYYSNVLVPARRLSYGDPLSDATSAVHTSSDGYRRGEWKKRNHVFYQNVTAREIRRKFDKNSLLVRCFFFFFFDST